MEKLLPLTAYVVAGKNKKFLNLKDRFYTSERAAKKSIPYILNKKAGFKVYKIQIKVIP